MGSWGRSRGIMLWRLRCRRGECVEIHPREEEPERDRVNAGASWGVVVVLPVHNRGIGQITIDLTAEILRFAQDDNAFLLLLSLNGVLLSVTLVPPRRMDRGDAES